MAQDLSSLIPNLISAELIDYLPTRPGLLGTVYTRSIPESAMVGGKTIKQHLPASMFTPTDVTHTGGGGTVQEIDLGSVDLTINNHKEIKITIDELEDIYSQGGADRILAETVPGIVNGLLSTADRALAALYSDFDFETGAYNSDITDAYLREALQTLANNGVQLEQPGQVHILTSPKGYFKDLLGIDRYVTPLNVGQVQNPSAIVSGSIPTLFNATVGWTQNIQTSTISSTSVAHSLIYNKYAFMIGFTKFNPATKMIPNANVDEQLITDTKTGVTIRQQKYYDPNLRRGYMQWDIAYGVATLDPNRFVHLLHKAD